MPFRRELILNSLSMPLYRSFRATGFPLMSPLHLAVAVTYRCRNRCLTCRVIDIVGHSELSPEEYRNVFSSHDVRPLFMTVTGGEPFVRGDIADVLDALSGGGPAVMSVHTCGDDPDAVSAAMRAVAGAHPRVKYLVLLSVDATGADLERLRGGAANAFEALLLTYRALRQIGAQNLLVGFQILVSRYNEGNAGALLENVAGLFPDFIALDMACGAEELNVTGSDVMPDLKAWRSVCDALRDVAGKRRGRALQRFLHEVNLRRAALAALSMEKMAQAVPCQAGHASLYISPAGSVKDCPVAAREMGSLRENRYDLAHILRTVPAARVRSEVRRSGCFCPMSSCGPCNVALTPRYLPGVIAAIL